MLFPRYITWFFLCVFGNLCFAQADVNGAWKGHVVSGAGGYAKNIAVTFDGTHTMSGWPSSLCKSRLVAAGEKEGKSRFRFESYDKACGSGYVVFSDETADRLSLTIHRMIGAEMAKKPTASGIIGRRSMQEPKEPETPAQSVSNSNVAKVPAILNWNLISLSSEESTELIGKLIKPHADKLLEKSIGKLNREAVPELEGYFYEAKHAGQSTSEDGLKIKYFSVHCRNGVFMSGSLVNVYSVTNKNGERLYYPNSAIVYDGPGYPTLKSIAQKSCGTWFQF